MKRALAGIAIAAVFWFLMFSVWTRPYINFWLVMTLAAVVLTAVATRCFTERMEEIHLDWKSLMLGVCLSAAMWGLFWIGNKLSELMFDFARPQVDRIYGMKADACPAGIALLLLFVIGPAEEIFWRGCVQKKFMQVLGPDKGFLLGTAAYTSIHIWCFNLMLILAALVCGFFWGLFYRSRPKQLFPLILSHALWDAAAFVIFPF